MYNSDQLTPLGKDDNDGKAMGLFLTAAFNF